MLKTSASFEEGAQSYGGILLRDLINQAGARGDTLIAHALDGYTAEIPASDANKCPAILAMAWIGQIMDVGKRIRSGSFTEAIQRRMRTRSEIMRPRRGDIREPVTND